MSEATPSFDKSTNTITLPAVDGIVYTVGGQVVEGSVEIKKPTTVRVRAEQGFVLDKSVKTDHVFVPEKKDAPKADSDSKDPADPAEKPKDADPIQTDAGGPPEAPAQSFGRTRS